MAKDLKRRIIAEFSAKNKAKGVMGGFRRDMDSVGRTMRRMAVGALAVAGVGGLGYMLKKQMEIIDATAKLSDRLGMSTEALIGMQHGANIAGVESETLNKALSTLSSRLGEVDMGVGQATYALEKLGLNYKDLIGLDMDEAIGIVADQIRSLSTQSEKAAAANYLFGKSGKQLLNLFEEGSAGVAKYQEEVRKLGLSFSRIDAAQVEAANDALTRARAVMTGLFRTATIELAPYIGALADKFVDVATAGEGVGAKVVNAFEAMSKGAIQFGQEIHGASAKFKAFRAGALEAAAELLGILTWAEKYTGGTLFDKIFGTEVTGGPGRKAEEYRQRAAELMESATKEAVSLYGQINTVEKFYDDLRKKAAGETTKTIKEQYADVLRAKIDMVDKEIAENERKLTEAKKAAEDEKNIVTARLAALTDAYRSMRGKMGKMTQDVYDAEMEALDNLEKRYIELGADKTTIDKWYAEQAEVLRIEYLKTTDDMANGFEAAGMQIKREMKTWGERAYEFSMTFQDSIAGGLERTMRDFDNWKEHLLNVFEEVYWAAMRIAFIEPAAGVLAKGFTAGVSGLFGGGGGMPTAGTVTPQAGATLARYQHGGVVTRPTLVQAGEVPEAFVPLRSGKIPVEMRGGAAGERSTLEMNVHYHGQEKPKITRAEEYLLSNRRIIDVTLQALQTDANYRRGVAQVK